MNIEPKNSVIYLLKGVPLDNSYNDTIYFSNASQQFSHFNSYTKKVFNHQSYQRVKRGWIRLQVCADDIYDYNYLMFQNSSFGNKWFYAFIKSVEYINNITSEIEFEIDVMQTWFFDYEMNRCFVERGHTATDNIGENILPEPVDVGQIICDKVEPCHFMDKYKAVVSYAEAVGDSGIIGGLIGGVIGG